MEWNKNISNIHEIGGNKIISKKHQKSIFLKREEFFYNLFGKNDLIKTPKIYRVGGLNLETYFIETEKKDFLQTAKDWAKVHSYYLENPIKENKLTIQHDLCGVSLYILNNLDVFGNFVSIVRDKISDSKVNKNLKTILHGDLQQKNMVTFQGDNYYFDFELGGIGHPARDIASMIISNPDNKEELLTTYKKYIDFYYSGLEEDVNNWLIARTAQLYIIFDKRKGTKEQKRFIKEKLSKIINGQ
tara:strand:- start:956 stop:1687 length:732 start_codon:yes stop_codon:yes gene_type:complete